IHLDPDEFVSSATSTMIVITYFFHANDYEFDAVSEFTGARPAGNNRDLFSILRECGYATDVICLNGFHHVRPRLVAVAPTRRRAQRCGRSSFPIGSAK